ncbi:MAG TPA: NAD-dependent epimerase/dehydratase family protein [Thermodesulfovibrionales bacterium]|nr:NAD-dependent epimerase/dehydratase family protein [Thermodesulfovibrionales bacterium]
MADKWSGYSRFVVTGASGFLGRHLMPVLEQRYGREKVIGLSSNDYDLMDPYQHRKMFTELKPEVLVHLAGFSGGIGANREYPADFYFRNTMLTALGFQHAAEFKVRKMVYPIGGCSYPATATSPIDEQQMWNGFPQSDSAGYSCAKKMGIVAGVSYRAQYGLSSSIIIPGNMYGEYDNFRQKESHVIPAMIRRYHEAKLANIKEVCMWGSGSPVRDFVYAGDVAALIPYFIEEYNSDDPVNISSGVSTSIKELSETIKELVDFNGEIRWDTSKPDGQLVKIFSVKKLRDLGLSCPTALKDGLKRTIRWFETNYIEKTDGIRL